MRYDDRGFDGSPNPIGNRRSSGFRRSASGGRPHRCPPRLNGWSLMMGSLAMVVMAVVTVASGAPVVGLIACGGLGVSLCGLVAAEIVNHYDVERSSNARREVDFDRSDPTGRR